MQASPRRPQALAPLLLFLLLVIALAPNLLVQAGGEPQLIRLQAASFDPSHGEPAVAQALRAAPEAGKVGTYLVQFGGPVEEAWKSEVVALGARLYGYIPDSAFLVRMTPEVAAKVNDLRPVRWVGAYHPAYRLAPDLAAMRQSATPAAVTVQTFPDADLDALNSFVAGLGGRVVTQSVNEIAGIVQVELPGTALEQLATGDAVVWVEQTIEPELFNDVGGVNIMRVGEMRRALGLYGAGQTVAVADTGFDTGAAATLHLDVRGRLVQGFCLGRPSPCDWSDPDGHGTHVAGSVLGNGTRSGSNPGAKQYDDSFAGVAPEARLVFQSIMAANGSLAGIPNDDGELMRQAYPQGARIHTNSWGGRTGGTSNNPEYGGYVDSSRNVDLAVWQMKDVTVLFAAGNQGTDGNSNGVVDPDLMAQPATAKNVISVGASENLRASGGLTMPWGSAWPSDFGTYPLSTDGVSDDANGLAAFSGRGPTDDGRIKPDVVAPGTNILSPRSSRMSGDGWGYHNSDYVYMGGTSMATPLTAGAAAVVREWLTTRRSVANPSAALVKAVLLNGAADMGPGQYGTGSAREIPASRPNNVIGWGRVDLVESLTPPAPRAIWLTDNTTGLNTGGVQEYTLAVGPGLLGQPIAAPTTSAPVAAPTTSAPVSQPDEARADGAHSGLLVASQGVNAPAETAVNILQNGGFESNSAWVMAGTNYTSASPRSGSRAMGSTANTNGSFYQLVTIPGNATAAQATFYWRNTPADMGYDELYFCIYSQDGSTEIGCANAMSSYDTTWQGATVNMASVLDQIRGTTVRVDFSIEQDDLSPHSVFYVDDASLDVTTSGTNPTATPTQRPEITPSPTATNQPSGGGAFRVMLTWSDYPGELAAARSLVNDLDLEVVAPNGTRYAGNQGHYTAGSACLRDNRWDRCNNVEGLILPNAGPGVYRVIVRGVQVPQGTRQPFALVASGDNLRQATATTPTATATRAPNVTPSPTVTIPPLNNRTYLPMIRKIR